MPSALTEHAVIAGTVMSFLGNLTRGETHAFLLPGSLPKRVLAILQQRLDEDSREFIVPPEGAVQFVELESVGEGQIVARSPLWTRQGPVELTLVVRLSLDPASYGMWDIVDAHLEVSEDPVMNRRQLVVLMPMQMRVLSWPYFAVLFLVNLISAREWECAGRYAANISQVRDSLEERLREVEADFDYVENSLETERLLWWRACSDGSYVFSCPLWTVEGASAFRLEVRATLPPSGQWLIEVVGISGPHMGASCPLHPPSKKASAPSKEHNLPDECVEFVRTVVDLLVFRQWESLEALGVNVVRGQWSDLAGTLDEYRRSFRALPKRFEDSLCVLLRVITVGRWTCHCGRRKKAALTWNCV